MSSLPPIPSPAPTPETVWATLQETIQLHKENEQNFKESEKSRKESERFLTEKFAETDRRFKQTEKLVQENAQRMKDLQKTFGSWANNFGSFAEEYFFTSFEKGNQNFFGEKFDEIEKHLKGIEKGYKDEYDIVLINGKSVGIVEVKYKGHKNDIPEVIKKAQTFRGNFPKLAHHKIYLGLATLTFYPELEEACTAEGIAIIKQVGNTVVINDAHLKAF